MIEKDKEKNSIKNYEEKISPENLYQLEKNHFSYQKSLKNDKNIKGEKLNAISDPLKMLTYNLFLRPPLINNNGNDYKNERTELICKMMEQYDIICFQELFPNYNMRRNKICKKAEELDLIFQARPRNHPLLSAYLVGSGLLTLSKYPIVKNRFFSFKDGAGIDGISYKGILYTKIFTGGSKSHSQMNYMHLFNAHLQASYDTHFDEKYCGHYQARLNQVVQLRDVITQCLKSYSNKKSSKNIKIKEKIMIVGDFNINSRAPKIPKNLFKFKDERAQDLIESFRGDTFSEYDFLVGCLSNFGEDEIIDHLFVNYKNHPVTYAESEIVEGKEIPMETVLTNKNDLCSNQSLDYMFEIIPQGISEEDIDSIEVLPASCMVRKFKVDEKYFSQLSDHYGVEITLINNY